MTPAPAPRKRTNRTLNNTRPDVQGGEQCAIDPAASASLPAARRSWAHTVAIAASILNLDGRQRCKLFARDVTPAEFFTSVAVAAVEGGEVPDSLLGNSQGAGDAHWHWQAGRLVAQLDQLQTAGSDQGAADDDDMASTEVLKPVRLQLRTRGSSCGALAAFAAADVLAAAASDHCDEMSRFGPALLDLFSCARPTENSPLACAEALTHSASLGGAECAQELAEKSGRMCASATLLAAGRHMPHAADLAACIPQPLLRAITAARDPSDAAMLLSAALQAAELHLALASAEEEGSVDAAAVCELLCRCAAGAKACEGHIGSSGALCMWVQLVVRVLQVEAPPAALVVGVVRACLQVLAHDAARAWVLASCERACERGVGSGREAARTELRVCRGKLSHLLPCL